jgi:hypothetical protein
MAKVFSPAAQAEVEMAPPAAQDAVLRGEVAVTGKQKVKKGDQILVIDASKLGEAIDMGWQLSDDEDAAGVILRREESDAASGAQGLAESAARGLTLGLSDQISGLFGADGERMAARREALGPASTGFEIAGAALPALLSGGAALAGTAARSGAARALAYTPAGAAAALGRGAEAVAARALGGAGASVAAQGARAVLPTAAGQAVEGFFFGAGNELTEAALGEREINAEKMLMEDGLMGAALGGIMGAGTTGLAKITSKGIDTSTAAARRIIDSLPTPTSAGSGAVGEATGSVIDSAARGMAKITGGNTDEFLKAGGYLKSARGRKTMYQAINDYDNVLESTAREVTTDVGHANARLAEAMEVATGASKMSRVAKLMPKEADNIAPRVSLKAMQDADDALAAIEAKAVKRGGYVLNDIEAARTRIQTAMAEAAENPNAVGSFQAMNRLKQDFDLITRRRKGQLTHEVQDTIGEIQKATGGIRKHLEREDLWGAAGKLQQDTNLAYSQMMRSSEDLGSRNSVLGRMLDPSTPVNPQDALSLTKQYGKMSGEMKFQKIDKALDDRLAYIESVKRNYDLSPEEIAKFDEAAAAVKKMRSTLADKAEVSEALEVAGKLRNAEGNGSPSIGALSSVGSMFGLSVGGPIGMLAGRAITSPHTVLRTLIGIGHAADNAGVKLDGAVGSMLGILRKKPSTGAASKRIATGSTDFTGGMTAAAVTGSQDRKTTRDKTLKLIDRVKKLTQDPNAIPNEVELPFFDATQAAPRLVSAMQNKIRTTAGFLASKAPVVYKAPFSKAPPQYDESQMAAFERYAAVAENPMIAFDHMSQGRMTVEDAESLRVCWPEIYKQTQDRIYQELADADAAGRVVDFDARIMTGSLFQIATDVCMMPSVFMQIQAVHTPAPQQPQGPQTGAAAPKSGNITTRDTGMRPTLSQTQRMQLPPGAKV